MSKREKLFLFLCQGGWKTSLEISKEVDTICAGTMAADMRKKGCVVWRKYVGRSSTGAMIHSYMLASFPAGFHGVGV
jgi:hypothetical protein